MEGKDDDNEAKGASASESKGERKHGDTIIDEELLMMAVGCLENVAMSDFMPGDTEGLEGLDNPVGGLAEEANTYTALHLNDFSIEDSKGDGNDEFSLVHTSLHEGFIRLVDSHLSAL